MRCFVLLFDFLKLITPLKALDFNLDESIRMCLARSVFFLSRPHMLKLLKNKNEYVYHIVLISY